MILFNYSTLFTANLSDFDPQLTDLQATLCGSYKRYFTSAPVFLIKSDFQ